MWPAGAWAITMKIDTHQHRHSRESGNPGSRDVGGHCESPTPSPWIPAYAGMTTKVSAGGGDGCEGSITVERLPSFSSPYLAFARPWAIPAKAGIQGRRGQTTATASFYIPLAARTSATASAGFGTGVRCGRGLLPPGSACPPLSSLRLPVLYHQGSRNLCAPPPRPQL